MSSDERQLIKPARSHFTMVPNCVLEMEDLSHLAVRLYCWYLRVCGDGGECYQSLATLAENVRANRHGITKARNQLENLGVISVERRATRNGYDAIIVQISDIWDIKSGGTNEDSGGVQNRSWGGTNEDSGGVQTRTTKKITFKKTKGRPAKARTPQRDSPVGFFEDSEIPEDLGKQQRKYPGLSEFDLKAGQKLNDLLVRNKFVPGNENRFTSANGFRLLRQSDGVSEKEIIVVVNWYKINITEQFVPKAFTSQQFREKWNGIKQAMKSQIEKNGGSSAALDQAFTDDAKFDYDLLYTGRVSSKASVNKDIRHGYDAVANVFWQRNPDHHNLPSDNVRRELEQELGLLWSQQ